MGQIVRRKKKGRPTKADLAADKKKQKKKAAADSELRRSGRRRNVRYTFDFDDYLFDDEDDEDERRREKKLKLLLKLHSSDAAAADFSPPPHAPPPTSAPSSPSCSCSADDDDKPSKKRKIDGGNDDEVDYGNDDDNNADYSQDVDNVEVKRRKKGEAAKDLDSAPGTPSEPPSETPSGFPLPEKKTLELILDKLQKKDIYGVYAKPVDPEELPDYHDVIKHPMDFSTIRSKLAKGSYANLEQFESDVFLICSNAMQYNAPDTIYYKQARNIQELAKRKFEKIRIKNERSEKELMLDQKPQSISILKKQISKPLSRRVQENVASDFSSGTTLATAGDIQNCSNAVQASGTERPGSIDGLAEGSPYVIDTSLDKIEEVLPGKGPLSRFGRKLAVHDENRATYNSSTEPVASSESIFSTFDGEIKQLIPVGLYVDHSYVRSLARFAGTLGPIAWRVASKRIEQVLPPGTKFGRGWVGEYEPPPTPVVMLENCTIKEPAFFMKPQHTFGTRKDEKRPAPVASSDSSVPGPTLEGKLPFFSPPGTKVTTSSSTTSPVIGKEPPVRGTNSRGKQSFFCSPRTTIAGSAGSHLQHQNSQTRHLTDSETKVQKQVELNCLPTTNQSLAHLAVEGLTPRSVEMVSMSKNLLPSGSFKQPNTSGAAVAALPNEKVDTINLDGSRVPVSSSDVGKVPTYSPRGQVQALTDPVELMRMLNGKNQNQQKFVNQSAINVPPVPSPAQSLSREDSGNAAAAAARAWMSIGAGGFRPVGGNMSPHKNRISADSLYNPTRSQPLQMSHFRGDSPAPALHFQPERNGFPFHGIVPEPARVGNTAQFQNRPVVFPQLLPTDLSRFQMQSPWRSLSPQTQQGQKQETVPPDLNVSFQSSGSPGRPSSGILVDSQQPDLALQL